MVLFTTLTQVDVSLSSGWEDIMEGVSEAKMVLLFISLGV